MVMFMAAGNATDDAEAKGRAVSCKGTKVAVTVGKKTTCQPIAKAIPRPRAIDPRLAFIEEAVKRAPAKGKKARKSGFRPNKRAQKKILKALPKALALLDRKAKGRAASSGLDPGPAIASSCAANGPAEGVGSVAGIGVAAAGTNGGQMTVPAGGQTYRVRYASCGGQGSLYVPECPNADGSVSASSGVQKFEVTEETLEGDRVVSRRNTNIDSQVKTTGRVASDAKLDWIVVDASEEVFIVATGGVVQRGRTEREVRVDMRSGLYDPSQTKVKITPDATVKDGEESFASEAEEAIKAYRVGENGGTFLRDDGWATFNRKRGGYCAEPVFNPDSNTIKLKKGDKKQIGLYAKARADGGRASGARWTLLNPSNADFTPGTSQDVSPTIQYAVFKSPQGSQVKVTVKFTSTAGVGEKTWTQAIEPSNGSQRLSGEFGGEYKYSVIGGLTEQTWHGTMTLEGSPRDGFELVSGSITVEASGADASQLSGCQQEAEFTEDVLGAGLFVTTSKGGEVPVEPPYEYLLNMFTASHALIIHRVSCDQTSKEEGFEGTEYPISPHYELFVEGHVSADGIDFSGTENRSGGGTTDVQYWSLHGTE